MAARLAPYLRYYASQRPTDDHGLRPDVLVVFEDEHVGADHFLRVAGAEMKRARVDLPLRVSYRALTVASGPFGSIWRAPAGGPPACLFRLGWASRSVSRVPTAIQTRRW